MSKDNDSFDPAQLGQSQTFTALGKVWTMQPVCKDHRDQFSGKLKVRAIKEVQALRPHLRATEFREQMALTQSQITAGAYNWSGPLDGKLMGENVSAALDELEWQAEMAALLMQEEHEGITAEEVINLIVDNPEGFAEAFRGALGFPNPEAPAKKTPGMDETAATKMVTTTPTVPAA